MMVPVSKKTRGDSQPHLRDTTGSLVFFAWVTRFSLFLSADEQNPRQCLRGGCAHRRAVAFAAPRAVLPTKPRERYW